MSADKEAAFNTLLDAFGNLTAEEKGNLLFNARTWPEGMVACGARASTYYDTGFA